jgi:histidine triad (HIT) family protein
VNHLEARDENLLGHMIMVARALAITLNLKESGYRLVINTGPDAGQSVHHLHLHLIGGRKMPFRFEE